MFAIGAQNITFVKYNSHGIYVMIPIPHHLHVGFIFSSVCFIGILSKKMVLTNKVCSEYRVTYNAFFTNNESV